MAARPPAPISGRRAYGAGVAVALLTALLIVWTTIVRDDGIGIGSLMLVLAPAVGAVAAWFRPAGLARAIVGTAVMQALLGLAIATAPSTALAPGATIRVWVSTAVFTAAWLVAATCFRRAARVNGLATPPQD